MVKTVRIHEFGGPEVMKIEDVDPGKPGKGQALMRHTAMGFNFIDIYHRSGLYKVPLPSGVGVEAVGVIEELGEGVTGYRKGDRVAAIGAGAGAYAEARVTEVENLVKLPKAVKDEEAAGLLLKGMTAEFLLRRTHQLKAGETILIHAAAGGVGQLLVQWAKSIGATVIATVGGNRKMQVAEALGAHHVINYAAQNFVQQVQNITGGKGVDVVYDSVGKDTFEGSLVCLRPRGLLVSYGNASGAVEGVNLGVLAQHGSLFVTRPTLFHYIADPEEREKAAKALFQIVGKGEVKLDIAARYSLDDVVQLHKDAQDRKLQGQTIILPNSSTLL